MTFLTVCGPVSFVSVKSLLNSAINPVTIYSTPVALIKHDNTQHGTPLREAPKTLILVQKAAYDPENMFGKQLATQVFERFFLLPWHPMISGRTLMNIVQLVGGRATRPCPLRLNRLFRLTQNGALRPLPWQLFCSYRENVHQLIYRK